MSDRAPVPAPRARPRPCGAASGPGQASGGRERGPRDPAPRGRWAARAGRRETPHEKTARETGPEPESGGGSASGGRGGGERGSAARAGWGRLRMAAPGGWRWHCFLRAGGGVRAGGGPGGGIGGGVHCSESLLPSSPPSLSASFAPHSSLSCFSPLRPVCFSPSSLPTPFSPPASLFFFSLFFP